MKTKIAMAISFAGVLVAGSAAALVNTQVLGGSTSNTGLAADSTSATQQTVPTATLVVGDSATAETGTTLVTPALPAAAPAATQAAYAVGDAGTVTLDTAGDALTIVGVTPASGWTVTKSENEDSANVEIKLQSATAEVEFHANLQFGVVTTSVESDDESSTDSSIDDNGGDDHGHGGDDDVSDDHGSGGGDDD